MANEKIANAISEKRLALERAVVDLIRAFEDETGLVVDFLSPAYDRRIDGIERTISVDIRVREQGR